MMALLDLPKLALVVPCYNEQEIILTTAQKLRDELKKLIQNKKISPESFIYFVNDGSRDQTWNLLTKLNTEDPHHYKALTLAHNAGHQNALLAGLFSTVDLADIMISLDADLQDDINVLGDFIDQYHQGNQIVYGVRRKRETDTIFKRETALLFYRLMEWFGVHIIPNHADFRLTSRQVIKELMEFREVNLFLRGLFPLIGFRHSYVYYDRLERMAGETKYPFKKMLSFAWNGITSFSVAPLRLTLIVGVIISVLSTFIIFWSLFHYLTNGVIHGWTSLIVSLYFLGGIQLMAIGIIGEYIGKIYKESKARPRFIKEKELL